MADDVVDTIAQYDLDDDFPDYANEQNKELNQIVSSIFLSLINLWALNGFKILQGSDASTVHPPCLLALTREKNGELTAGLTLKSLNPDEPAPQIGQRKSPSGRSTRLRN